MVSVSRRALLVRTLAGSLGLLAASCARPPASGAPVAAATPTAVVPGEADLRQEAKAILDAGQQVLDTFDTYAAFRISAADSSTLRLPSEPVWDPPTDQDWQAVGAAIHTVNERGLALVDRVSSSIADASLWRERRDLALYAHHFTNLAQALDGYRAIAQQFTPGGDGSLGNSSLQKARATWQAVADEWQVATVQVFDCAA